MATTNLQIIISAIDKASKTIEGVGNRFESMGKKMNSVGKKMTMGLSMPLAGIGTLAIKTGAQFEQSMANAASVSGATGEEFKKMQKIAREMGKATVFSASEAADAMYYMASAGWKVDQMGNAIKPTLDLAAATQSDLAETTDVVVSALNQFGLESKDTDRVANVFAATIGNSQATLEKLAYSMRYVGPVAKSLGYSIEETSAALGILYNAGFKGEQAGTILRGALSRLASGSKPVMKVLDELGISFEQVNPEMNSMSDIIKILGEKGITTTQALALFGQEAGPGMMAMIGKGAGALDELKEKITGTNSATEMAERQTQTLSGSIKLLKSTLEEAFLMISEIVAPILKDFIDNHLKPWIQKFQELSPATKKLIIVIAAFAMALGPVLMVLGTLIGSLKNVALAIKIVGIVIKAFSAHPLILAIMAVVAVAIYFYKHWEEICEGAKYLWEGLSYKVKEIANSIKEVWEKLIGWIEGKINWVKDKINQVKNIGAGIGGKIKGTFSKAEEWVSSRIPHFQHGGIVPGVGPKLAMVHGGETIIPRGKNFGNINVYIQGGNYLDREAGEKFAEILGKMLRKQLRYQRGY